VLGFCQITRDKFVCEDTRRRVARLACSVSAHSLTGRELVLRRHDSEIQSQAGGHFWGWDEMRIQHAKRAQVMIKYKDHQ
jgi:hypothetical protein